MLGNMLALGACFFSISLLQLPNLKVLLGLFGVSRERFWLSEPLLSHVLRPQVATIALLGLALYDVFFVFFSASFFSSNGAHRAV